MDKKNIIFLLITIFSTQVKTEIKHVFIDPNVIFTTSQSKAADYVGRWEAFKYTAATGHLPSQERFFKALQDVPAASTVTTYDETYKAPLIISDWLLGVSPKTLTEKIELFLESSKLSNPEKNVYLNTINMMFNSESLAEVQKVRRKIGKLLKQLKEKKYTIYFAGNWTDIEPLKKKFPDVFKYIDHVYTSSEMKLLKPQKDFWKTIWISKHLDPKECLCIESEPQFYETASELECKTVLYRSKKIKQFFSDLQDCSVTISL